MTDEEYYLCYLNGDDRGLEELMRRYESQLILYIAGYVGDLQVAEDLMMDVFTYLFVKKPHIRPGRLRAYLYKAARNIALGHKRRWHPTFSMDQLQQEPQAMELVEEVMQNAQLRYGLRVGMGQLAPAYREALYLTYFEGMSYAEAARVMGKSIKQITNLVYRGKQSLRQILQKGGYVDEEP